MRHELNVRRPLVLSALDGCGRAAAATGAVAWVAAKNAAIAVTLVAVAVPFILVLPYCMHYGDIPY